MLIWTHAAHTFFRNFIFLDRDGVLNEDRPDHVKNIQEFKFYPDTLEALRWLRRHGVGTILVSNQSGLHRGLIPWSDFWALHTWLVDQVHQAGGEILAAFYCPHRPDEQCRCRKPASAMLTEAAKIYPIALNRAVMIGDRSKDVNAAIRAGCRGILLDRSGSGLSESEENSLPGNVSRFPTLLDGVLALAEHYPML
jgi:D-glycero-D-manno-heptose 1,7-bisphosphate phosphatase